MKMLKERMSIKKLSKLILAIIHLTIKDMVVFCYLIKAVMFQDFIAKKGRRLSKMIDNS